MPIFKRNGNRLEMRDNNEKLWIEPWGRNALRVRCAKQAEMPSQDWALLPCPETMAEITEADGEWAVTNGKIRASVSKAGRITFTDHTGKNLLREFSRNARDTSDSDCSLLKIEAREFKPILGGDFKLTARFESDPDERIYGMGQYQQPMLNLKGCELELAQRNSQISVPFMLSSLGYGMLWNNPAIGSATFGRNVTSYRAESTKILDYWITAGDTPAAIEETYAAAVGTAPMMPDYAMGFWQCKLRYQTQEELLNIAREYKRRGIPLSVIVIDYFHWPLEGDWKFDEQYWPDPEAMTAELRAMGVELMVSVWPTVSNKCANYREMRERGLLINPERGVPASMSLGISGYTLFADFTNPEAREYVWDKIKANYYDKGIRLFWLDVAEPEFSVYDFDNYRYHTGPVLQVGNIYPAEYAKTFYNGLAAAGEENPVSLLRCAWAGSQKYGALVWSGDIHSSFQSFRRQVAAGLNMAIAGIPWWTTDIGGFLGGNPDDPAFRELLVRWFEYGAFCPVMRIHGNREPVRPGMGASGGALQGTGADNEIWSFGAEAYEICKKYIELREGMKPYIRSLMRAAHEKGSPVMRPLFYDFPQDKKCWEVETQYMFGPDYLVAPVLSPDVREMRVYLPAGAKWEYFWTKQSHEGGQSVTVPAPLDQMPVFIRKCK